MEITTIDAPDHERVVEFKDAASGLSGFVAIHSTQLGPAAGGVRMRTYGHPSEALDDALRLSRGMTYKNAAADLPLGGGKAVIIGNPTADKTPNVSSSTIRSDAQPKRRPLASPSRSRPRAANMSTRPSQ